MERHPNTVLGTAAGRVVLGDNLAVLEHLPPSSVDLVYIDPPFNTGRDRVLQRVRTSRAADGDRVGFQEHRYRTEKLDRLAFPDHFGEYRAFLAPRLEAVHRVLKSSGTLYFHIDPRQVHHCRFLLDGIFGPQAFLNEIIWAYDYGGRPTRRWAPKHDNILVYVKDPLAYYFDAGEVDRIPYLAPGLVGAAKAARGKLPTDTWWHTIVPTSSRERTGYPTQKPLGILRRIVQASSPPGGLVADFFAGSGTTGMAAHQLGRLFLLVDENPAAFQVMTQRFAGLDAIDLVDSPADRFPKG